MLRVSQTNALLGHSTANAVARVAAILCPFLVEDSPLIVMGAVMLAIHAFAVLCVAQLPETKGSQMGSTSGGRAADTNTSFAISEEEVVDEPVVSTSTRRSQSFRTRPHSSRYRASVDRTKAA